MTRLFVGFGVDAGTKYGIVPRGPSPITSVDFGFSTVQTLAFDTTPETDPSGKDFLYRRVTLEISGVVNRCAVSTNKAKAAPPGPEGTGDDVAFSVFNLQDFLLLPRQYFRFEIGDTVVLESPRPTAGPRLFMDAKGGPMPDRATYTPITGSKSAFLHWRVTTWLTYGSSALLSNRWRQSVAIDDTGMSVRTTTGKAIFRLDYMNPPAPGAARSMPDDFRKFLFVPVSAGMTRGPVHVAENDPGSEVDYSFEDVEHVWGLGASSDVLEVVGTTTGGVDFPIKDLKGAATAAAGPLKAAPGLITRGPFGAWDFLSSLGSTVWSSAVPTCRFMGLCRATGRRDASRANLQALAATWLLDRLKNVWNPTTGIGKCVSCYVTFNHDTRHAPFCEMKVEVLGVSVNIITALIKADPTSALNLSSSIVGKTATYTADTAGPQLPNSSNTRGTWTGRLVAQILLSAANVYVLPDNLPADTKVTASEPAKLF